MRAHGITEDPAMPDSDEEPPIAGGAEWDHKRLDLPAGSKTLYALRPNASRVRGHRVCENCGKEFQSWKSFLDHGRCESDKDPDGDELSPPSSPQSAAWYKGKRSQRQKPSSNTPLANYLSAEDEDLAHSLVMLSSAEVDPVIFVAEPEESSASTSKEEEDPAFVIRCAAETTTPTRAKPPMAPITPPVPRGMFECKACKKVFTSHQALGGHRASHKKVKGCFAARLDPDPDPDPEEDVDQIGSSSAPPPATVPFIDENPHPPISSTPLKRKSRVHECSICHRQFSSGQALGGHKRCHWITSSSGSTEIIPTTTVNLQHHKQEIGSTSGAHSQDFTLRPMLDSSDTLDLNLPAPADDLAGIPLRLDAPAAIYIEPPWDIDNKTKLAVYKSSNNDINNDDRKNLQASNPANLEDEAESKVEVAKLSDLKDMKVEEESSPWLQVGIGGSSATKDGRRSSDQP
ncbi:Zinc finger protein ZAT3 [Platanthera guangdongensis]|uniref:Zinc finger protein ZAT3 n=1 Tax=Platanthera guangdongensis TaxID=2320717 RepID=A0ABR2MHJ2_9ASPA